MSNAHFHIKHVLAFILLAFVFCAWNISCKVVLEYVQVKQVQVFARKKKETSSSFLKNMNWHSTKFLAFDFVCFMSEALIFQNSPSKQARNSWVVKLHVQTRLAAEPSKDFIFSIKVLETTGNARVPRTPPSPHSLKQTQLPADRGWRRWTVDGRRRTPQSSSSELLYLGLLTSKMEPGRDYMGSTGAT
jgi:hypothetical protein